ncbi:MAG: molybdopterin converting factor subunit 1 [Candidatus Devosia phytovorans]|uniref:Molybdopterin converting factor subunit 1 n=1 Tax=Candidatus Devosia phytovorans TaxID=3121372 RepID=A0AAJ6B0M0_9HYPH|nr:molybdopterin converting factor subunit 1 [Devosia sp.]WEK05347.1 MAG: molybdopterin converting factor subunit 1 [Devosia sp.]
MKILYFAWLRERLNRGEEELTLPPEVVTVADLIDYLASRDEAFAHAAEKRALIRAAVDAKLARPETSIIGAQTVALFPPMTGG